MPKDEDKKTTIDLSFEVADEDTKQAALQDFAASLGVVGTDEEPVDPAAVARDAVKAYFTERVVNQRRAARAAAIEADDPGLA